MAVVNTKSTLVSNSEAEPKVLNNPRADGGFERVKVATVSVANGDSSTSTFRFFRVPSNAIVHQLLVYSPDIGTTTVADFGLYDTAAAGGAVVDADVFASAVSLKDGALNGTDVTHESGVYGTDEAGQELWQVLGLTSDPVKEYEVVATLTGAADAAGTITLKMRYSA